MVQEKDKRTYSIAISIGSNLGDKRLNIDRAISLLRNQSKSMEGVSSFYESDGWGSDNLSSFYNVCIVLNTNQNPEGFLKSCLRIEEEIGRVRLVREKTVYEDRIIDIDIILIKDMVIESENLSVPHPFMHKRNFVLCPLAEIAADWMHPVLQKSVKSLRDESLDSNRTKLKA